jgi:hypothetical protein
MSAVFLLCTLVGGPAARADDPSAWHNPFCSADVQAFPWDRRRDEPAPLGRSDRYVLDLSADGTSSVAATVTLISTQGAYGVTIDRTVLKRDDDKKYYAPAMMVGFDAPRDVEFAYIDSVGVDGAAPTPCPTVVQEVHSMQGKLATGKDAPSFAGVAVTAAAFKQDLPALDCGAAYIEPVLLSREGPDIGHFGDRPLTTTIHVYLDSAGHPVNATLEKSSGVEGVDDVAIAGAEQSHYKPAKFLCTPVVSEMSVEFDYGTE